MTMIVHWVTLLFFLLTTVPCDSLICFDCRCQLPDVDDCNCNDFTDVNDNTYCMIVEQRYTDNSFIELTRIDRNATWIYIEDTYYILVQESIIYNQTSGDWYTWPRGVVFGCDWDYCNSPSFVLSLPDSFRLTVDKTWLTQNIYGTGSVTGCNHCPDELCGNLTNPIDYSQCPIQPCVNSSTCVLYNLYNNLQIGQMCFQSECAPESLDDEFDVINGGKYKLQIEAIVYLAQDRSKFNVWELDVFCGAVNCSRPTIFDEVRALLSADISNLTAFPVVRPTTTIPPRTTATLQPARPLRCYTCSCYGATCPCINIEVSSADNTYCTIVQTYIGQNVYTDLEHIDRDSTRVYVREFPFVIVEETIAYQESYSAWFTTTNLVIYGCNWDYCNRADLVFYLPGSFQMRLSEDWLNVNVLGTGAPARDCHECPDDPSCGPLDFIDPSQCPVQSCNRTCHVSELYDDPASNNQCYQSFCAPPNDPDYEIDQHRVELEGILYGNRPNAQVELWEIDIYCRADDCSSPEIFNELKSQLSVQSGDLSKLFNISKPAVPQLRCFSCYCFNDPLCPCNTISTMDADQTYCTIVQENFAQDIWVDMENIDRNSTQVYIRDFPYLLVQESIIYREQTAKWDTVTNLVIYGCNWDLCNDPRLVPFLPATFQMRINETWLNNNVLGTGAPVRNCHQCPQGPQCGPGDFLNASTCPVQPCNTTCLVSDTFDNPAGNLQCYQSYCAPPNDEDFEIDPHRVEMEGLLYLNRPQLTVELWEVDVFCRADDCSRPEIFKEINDLFTTQIGDVSNFLPAATVQPPDSTTVTRPTDAPTTRAAANSLFSTPLNILGILLLSTIFIFFQ